MSVLTSDQDWDSKILDHSHNLKDPNIWSDKLAHPAPCDPEPYCAGYFVLGVIASLLSYSIEPVPLPNLPDLPINNDSDLFFDSIDLLYVHVTSVQPSISNFESLHPHLLGHLSMCSSIHRILPLSSPA